MSGQLFFRFFFLLLLAPSYYNGQPKIDRVNYNFYNQKGLRGDEFFGIAQDFNGVLWVGSTKGIYRFDGQNSRLYSRAEGIISRVVTRIFLLRDSSLIALGEKPYALYRIKNDKLHVLHPELEHRLNGNYVCLNHDKTGIYAYSSNGSKILRVDKDSIHTVQDSIRRISSLFHSPSGKLIVCTVKKNKGDKLNPKGDTSVTRVLEYPTRIKYIVGNNGNNYALSQEYLIEEKAYSQVDTLARFTPEDNILKPHFLVQDDAGGFWFSGETSGLHYFDPNTKKVSQLDAYFGLSGVQITYLFKDNDDNIWLSTMGRGLQCIRRSIFKNYTKSEGLPNNYITQLQQTKNGVVWVGTYSGLSLLKKSPLSSDYRIKTYAQLGFIQRLSKDRSERIFVSNERGFPSQPLNAPKGTYFIPEIGLSVDQLLNGEYIYSSWRGLRYFENYTDIQQWQEKIILQIIAREPIKKLIQVNTQQFALTGKALYKREANDLCPIHIPLLHEEQQNNTLAFYDMVEGANQEIWIGSSEGLLHKKGESWTLYNVEDGLHDEVCKTLEYEPGENRLWIGANDGLISFWKGNFNAYTKSDGLLSNEVNAILNDSINDCIWVATGNGLSQLQKSRVDHIPDGPKKVAIYQAEIMNDTSIAYPNDMRLEAFQDHLTIYFSAPYLFFPEEAEYQFKLEGVHNTWQKANQNSPRAEFMSLSPGDYTFKARSRKLGSEWGEVSNLRFIIATPFWKRTSFWVGAIILFVFITISVAQLRIKNIKKKERNKRQMLTTMNDLELQAFHYSMNPHFLFNSLNSIQQFITKYRDAVAINFISEFSLLVRNNLEALRSGWISLDSEIEQLERYLSLESHRLNHALSYKIEVDPSISLSQVEVPPLFIQPFIENSIWHGIAPKRNKEGSFIGIKFHELKTDVLSIIIEDNGVGLHAGQSNKKPGHVSRGIELIQKRLQLLSEKNQFDIMETKDDEGNPSGTLVNIIFHVVN